MLISHEVPIPMLKESRNFNQYDYALLHLFDEQPEYLKFYQESSAMGRKVLLDNSAFELGDAMTSEKLMEGIEKCNPTWFVVPDALNNAELTIQRWEDWQKATKGKYKGAIGVVQGKTWEDYKECYKYFSDKADKIALPMIVVGCFDGYTEGGPFDRWIGRTHIIRELMREGIWNFDKPHHLLGATNPVEFSDPLYLNPSFDSVDTSSPIMAAINNTTYSTQGLLEKPAGKLFEHILDTLTSDQKDLMYKNIHIFKKIAHHL